MTEIIWEIGRLQKASSEHTQINNEQTMKNDVRNCRAWQTLVRITLATPQTTCAIRIDRPLCDIIWYSRGKLNLEYAYSIRHLIHLTIIPLFSSAWKNELDDRFHNARCGKTNRANSI